MVESVFISSVLKEEIMSSVLKEEIVSLYRCMNIVCGWLYLKGLLRNL